MEEKKETPQKQKAPTSPILPKEEVASPPSTTPEKSIEPTPKVKTNKWIFTLLTAVVVISVSAAGYFAFQYYQLRQKDGQLQPAPNLAVTPISESTDQNIGLPLNWITKTSAMCNVDFPLPPKEEPYYHPLDPNKTPSLTDDVGSGRYWQFEERENSMFQFTHVATARYANDSELSGYISGAVQVFCAKNTDSYDSKQALNQLNFFLAEGQGSVVKIISSNKTTQWNKEVYELTFEGGMFDSNQKHYLFTTSSNWYLVTKIIKTQTETIKDTTNQIFNNLKFL
jgi:hypothetical protein